MSHIKEQASAWFGLAWFYLSVNLNRNMLAIGVGIVLLCGLFYGLGYYPVKHSYQELEIALTDLIQEQNIEWQEDDSWYMRVAMIKQQINVTTKTIERLKGLLQNNSFTIEDLEEQIYFYKSVVAPEELGEGLAIFSTTIAKPVQGEYPIKVVLKKIGKEKMVMKGHIEIYVSGMDQQKEVKLTGVTSGNMAFSFNYFQRVNGMLRLPQGFVPEQLTVTVVSSKFAPLIQTYAWDDIISDILISGG